MSQLPVENLPLNPSALATTAATVVRVAIPLIQYAASELKQKYYDYNEEEMKVINQIRELYRNHCYPQEYKGTVSTHFPGLEGEGELNRDFPIYFQMDPERDKQPLFFVRKIKTIMHAQEWNAFLKSSSALTDISGGIKDMIGHVCNYQVERNKGCVMITEKFGVGGKGYYYDPTNIFLEEFKRWLVELSHAPLDEKTLAAVEGRMNYLRKIDICDVFKQSQRIITRRETVIKLLDNLRNTIRPIIQSSIAAQSSREHYDLLKKNIHALIRTSAQFCFYVFRDTPKTPASFILENMQQAKHNYEQVMKGTRTGLLLYQLFNSPVAQIKSNKDKDITTRDLQFAGSISELLSDAPEYEKTPWGMLPHFQNYAFLQKFFKLHSLIERLFIFEKIADDLYGLAGKGGDILVYGYLAPKTQDAMHSYCVLLRELESVLHDLHAIADQHRISIIERPKKPNNDEMRWIEHFAQADNAFEELCYRWSKIDGSEKTFSTIGESVQLVRKIQAKMDQVNTPEYKEQLLKDVEKFSRWMILFAGNEASSGSSVVRVEPLQEKVDLEPAPLEKLLASSNKSPLQAMVGNDSFSFLYEPQEPRSDGLFLLLGATSREECVNQLLGVCNNESSVDYLSSEIRQVYKAKKLPGVFDVKQCTKYHKLIDGGKFIEADDELNNLCRKGKNFLRIYLQHRYLTEKYGVPYAHNRKGTFQLLVNLFERECYIFQLNRAGQLEFLERIECRLAKNPPVYLLISPPDVKDREIDYPHFHRLVDLRQPAKEAAKQNNWLGPFNAVSSNDKALLLQQADQAYQASQIKRISREERVASLNLAIQKIDVLIELDAKNHKYHLLRAIYVASKGDQVNRLRSITDFDLALKYCPLNDNAECCRILYERGITFANIQSFDKALDDYNEILRINPNNHKVRLLRADLYFHSKQDNNRAMEDYSYIVDHLKEGEFYLKALKCRLSVAMLTENYTRVVEDAMEYSKFEPGDSIVESKREQAVMKLSEQQSKKGAFGK